MYVRYVMCVNVRMHCMHARTYALLCVYMDVCVCLCAGCIYIYIYIYIRVYSRIHLYIYIYAYTHVCVYEYVNCTHACLCIQMCIHTLDAIFCNTLHCTTLHLIRLNCIHTRMHAFAHRYVQRI